MIITKSEKVKKGISYYQTKLRNIRTSISGKDLINIGIKPGPKYKYILKTILLAKIDEKIKSSEEEIKLAKTMLF